MYIRHTMQYEDALFEMMFLDILQHTVGIGSMTSDDNQSHVVRQQGQCLYSLQDVFTSLYRTHIKDITFRQMI